MGHLRFGHTNLLRYPSTFLSGLNFVLLDDKELYTGMMLVKWQISLFISISYKKKINAVIL